jgi:hypothetical protein
MTIDAAELVRRIAEVEALAAGGIPGLRSPELWPAELLAPRTDASPPGELLDRLLGDAALTRAAVEQIAGRRRAALRARGAELRQPRPGGRFLCTDLSSDLCDAARPVSEGFFDVDDLPPWGTWLAYVETGASGGIVACWVPGALVAAADRGVSVIPVLSAWWDDDPVPGQRQLFPSLPGPRGVE